MIEHGPAGSSWLHCAGQALQQRHSNFAFYCSDLMRQGRLSDMQSLGCTREGRMVRHRGQVLKLPKSNHEISL
jgi:hypothetical protein